MSETPSPEASEGGFISHLLELRNRLLYCVIAVGVVFAGLLPFANHVYVLIAKPLMDVPGASMIATDVASPFITPIKLTLMVAVVLAVPFLLYQVWAFVAPGLYRHERRLVVPLLVSSTALFYCGMTFAYLVVFPVVFDFFIGTAPADVAVMTDIKSYLDFVFTLFFAFGIAFEVPVAVVLLARLGAINPATLGQKRPYVILGIFVIAAILTPPDVFSQTFLAIPMIVLFEVGLFFARRVRPREASDAESGTDHRELSDAEMEAEFEKHDQTTPRRRGRRKSRDG